MPVLPPEVTAADTHCHLDMDAYDSDKEDVIRSALDKGIGHMITVGIDLKSSKAAVAIAEKHPEVYATVGIHPHHVKAITDGHYTELETLASHPKVVAYGEIGMDLVRCYAPPELQKEHFQRQLVLARTLDMPVIIHDREAHADILQILKNEGPFPAGGVMHCFSGDITLAPEVINLGFMISLPGVVTFDNATDLQRVAKEIPLTSLLFETDAPFLAPVPKRGKRNEPLYVLYTAKFVAELRREPFGEIVRKTTENAVRLFGMN